MIIERYCAFFAVVLLAPTVALDANAQQRASEYAASEYNVVCPKFFTHDPAAKTDYRTRNISAHMRLQFKQNWDFHTGPAVDRVNSRDFDHPMLMPDIDFTLQRWPNHMDAIRALIQFELAGGNLKEHPPTDCYLYHARTFAPDDVDVVLAAAYYHHRKGQKARAKQEYLAALEMSPNHAEAHYNLGLLYADEGSYGEALEHAHQAYQRGYPLLGLRKRLEDAGRWRPYAEGQPNNQ